MTKKLKDRLLNISVALIGTIIGLYVFDGEIPNGLIYLFVLYIYAKGE